ncbi:CRISPR-associated protein, Csy2 family [Bathymodiolus thermophilus thioautotrophic gill symbiont]|nr:type I-F CRISPR-associated protein Csy2 [Bathymodiolus thermophilus thioautotrophic gill symbiont]CAB5499170.1 CRISPR-associated protein, Csy2 family [Bathymodiolus thermophilus thioautotrophic gill symbiont]
MKQILLIPRVKIHNANALSSPYTIGFPAMSGWLGFMHNLQRRLSIDFENIKFNGVAVSVHEINLHTNKSENDFNYSIISKRNPMGKDGKPTAFIEEARCDLEVSIAIECENIDPRKIEDFYQKLTLTLHQIKIVSGDVMGFNEKGIKVLTIKEEKDFKNFIRYLMPGFCLVSRQDLMQQEMQNGKDGIDALLGNLKITTIINIHNKKQGKIICKKNGWIVPIAVGFQGISDLSEIKNSRDNQTPHRFSESVVALGEFIMPYRFDNIEQLFWRYKLDAENNLYLFENNFIDNNQQESKL